MTLDFNLDRVRHIEFGVGLDEEEKQKFCNIPVDYDVQTALQAMAEATWSDMLNQSLDPVEYQPSEKYAGTEHLILSVDDDLAKLMRELHQATNLPQDPEALSNPANIFCYFTRMVDEQDRSLTALRRASQFKGVVKSRLIRWLTDALKLVEEPTFKLDKDFDLLIDSSTVHILRPSGFEFAGKLQDAVLEAMPQNVQSIQAAMDFVEFSNIQDYASKHTRAARYLASIRSEGFAENIDTNALKSLCNDTGVKISESDGKISVQDGYVMGFLEVLDRRRYELELRRDSPEYYRASGRQRLGE